MNDDLTKKLHDTRSFEERVFARFDALDARLDQVDNRFSQINTRFNILEARIDRVEARTYDTKPIWERAVSVIMKTQEEVGEIRIKVEAIENAIGSLRTAYASLLESQQSFKKKIVRRIDLLLETLVDTHENQRNSDARLTLLESRLA